MESIIDVPLFLILDYGFCCQRLIPYAWIICVLFREMQLPQITDILSSVNIGVFGMFSAILSPSFINIGQDVTQSCSRNKKDLMYVDFDAIAMWVCTWLKVNGHLVVGLSVQVTRNWSATFCLMSKCLEMLPSTGVRRILTEETKQILKGWLCLVHSLRSV